MEKVDVAMRPGPRPTADLNVTRALRPVVWSARGSGYRTNYIT
jgi:hypothetical protein